MWAMVSVVLGVAFQGSPVRFESEAQRLTGDAEVRSDVSASEGRYVQLGKAGSVVWNLEVPEAGRYELRIRYRTGGSDRAQTLAVAGRARGIGFPMTAGEWEDVRTIRRFAKGANQIELKADWGEMDVDYVRFQVLPRGELHPVVEPPVVTPMATAHQIGGGDVQFKLAPGDRTYRGAFVDGREIESHPTPYPFEDDALWIRIPAKKLDKLRPGAHRLELRLSDGASVSASLRIDSQPPKAPFTITALDISHGTATFLRLPNGETAMIDTAKPEFAESVVVPWLRANRITKVDHLIVTHYHDDHVGGRDAVRKAVRVGRELDNKSFRVGDVFDLGGVKATVLNATESGTEENSRSLALRLEYRGFVYQHGGDTYGMNQVAMLARFPAELLAANVFHANHHLHGSIDTDYYRTVNPQLVLISAEEAVYARGAYATHYRDRVELPLRAFGHLKETLITREVGSVVLRIHDRDRWTYETYPEFRDARP